MPLDDDWFSSYDDDDDRIPPHRTCGAVATNATLMERNPAFRSLLGSLEVMTTARFVNPDAFRMVDPVTIPVIVHVVHSTTAQNISDEQVQSQIEALNRDFGASNPDISIVPPIWAGLPADTRIRFALAQRDPDGNPHSGITRTATDVAGFTQDEGVKATATGGIAPWPADRYLNIWACNLLRILGYAQFPGGPPKTDGVVIGYRYFGTTGAAVAPFNLGRTATHEVGHWLNLRHIWGDIEDCSGSDLVDDTPRQQLPNYNSPTYPMVSCTNGPHGDMFMNYMDYVDDAAMVMFTPGQTLRMQTALQELRSAIMTSDAIDR
jgi:hypothetical protein